MKKKLNTDTIAAELREHSHFFRRPQDQQDVPTPRPPDLPTSGPPDAQGPSRRDVWASRHQDTSAYDITMRAEDRQTLRLTQGELRKLGSMQARLSEELGVRKVDKNDIIRCGLHQLFEDFDALGTRSGVALRLRKKYR